MEKILFAKFTKAFTRTIVKIPTVTTDDPIFRLHYKFTCVALLFASILISGYQFFGNPIMCIQKDDIPEQLLNTYCWTESTFTLPKALFKEVGTEVVYPGVDKYIKGDEVVRHTYYQWVCFVLFLQALMFSLPYYLWRVLESGEMKALVEDLKNPILSEDEESSCFVGLAHYFLAKRREHHSYAINFFMCELLNLINVIGQIYWIDAFLGGEFQKYGADVVKFTIIEQEDRIDPMIKVFPRITKCTFHKYGSSGDVQKHDALCLLPLNILNEKIFVVMWFWFIILAVLGCCLILYRLIVMLSGQARYLLLTCVASLTANEDIRSLVPLLSYGDWFFLYLLADNIDNSHFRKLVIHLKRLAKPRLKYKSVSTLDDVGKSLASKDMGFPKESSQSIEKDENSV